MPGIKKQDNRGGRTSGSRKLAKSRRTTRTEKFVWRKRRKFVCRKWGTESIDMFNRFKYFLRI
jgi:hypothetical protein